MSIDIYEVQQQLALAVREKRSKVVSNASRSVTLRCMVVTTSTMAHASSHPSRLSPYDAAPKCQLRSRLFILVAQFQASADVHSPKVHQIEHCQQVRFQFRITASVCSTLTFHYSYRVSLVLSNQSSTPYVST